MNTMNRIALGVAAALISTLGFAPAHAANYSGNRMIGATLSRIVACSGGLVAYEVDVRNDSRRPHWFRVIEAQAGAKLSDRRERVARRATAELLFVVPAGKSESVTVVYRGEVLLNRHLIGKSCLC